MRRIALTAILLSWPAIALAQQSVNDFQNFRLGTDFQKPSGFTYAGEIMAGPGIRVDAYSRTYEEETVTINTIGVYNGQIISKQQFSFASTKTTCAEGIILMVEGLMSAGIKNWQKTWREDYQVPVYKTDVANIRAKVTCRMSKGRWFLEYSQVINRFNLP